MEDVEKIVGLLLAVWFFITTNSQEMTRKRRLVARRGIEAADARVLAARRDYWRTLTTTTTTTTATNTSSRLQCYLKLLRRPRPCVWMVDRATEWWNVIVPSFTHTQWVENFRMSEETYVYLCNKLRPAMEKQDTSFRVCIPFKKRVAIALWKLATGCDYRSIGHLFGVSKTTVCRCVQDFCAAAETLLVPELIRSPDREKFAEMAAYTENRWGLPQCVGAIDGSHIPILAPQEYHCDYFNRKGWHSIILQGVVDGKGHFWNVFAGMPGSMHDARVLRLSTLWELASRGNYFPACTRNIGGVNAGYYILGDNAYPLQNWLIKPFADTGRLTEEHVTYNKKICRVRVVVENAFGRLKGRWRCLMKRNDCDVKLVKSMVLTCCALHNLCESHGETYDDGWDAPAAAEPGVAVAQGAEEEGRDIREGLMRYLNP
ncbi:protein ANTAGONIST OF LIKE HETEROCHROMATIN PROTEIN 1-like [Trematomus bernacchii]|uniref:protein ANTAGONIST OF LIKE HETEROCHROMATIN PROTEIN 1-like n=1 Tax=Trematomus bernacchii TaxID=40690 RepID=UPI00146E7BA0|nr:protein ANTAGONIST OF LIKE HETEROCHROMATIN PROTEIN 1-like [Trematomus bernacchii]